jgi:hypothetical protein
LLSCRGRYLVLAIDLFGNRIIKKKNSASPPKKNSAWIC